MNAFTVERLDAERATVVAPLLADILIDCVEGGASVGFLAPLSREKALKFWEGVIGGVSRGERALLVVCDEQGEVCGTVHLAFALMENQPHRAEVTKLLVHRRARRMGVGELLMRAVEQVALSEGRTLLVLDTATDDAIRLYERLGWALAGVIPNYALNPDSSFCDTHVYWKALA